MKMFMAIFVTGMAILLLSFLNADADCECSGKSQDYIYRGGDKQPLTWYSLQRLEQPVDSRSGSPPVYCYERKVQNHSNQEINDVYWPVAGYLKKVLPAFPADCCCDAVSIPDVLKRDHPSGPLYYGPGSTSQYMTTTYAPKGGWQGFGAKVTSLEGVRDQPPLISRLQIALRTSQGRVVVSNIRLQSKIVPMPGSIVYHYEFYNQGTEPLFIFWNIPQTKQFTAQFAMDVRNPLMLPPGQRIARAVESSEYPAWAGGAVLIFDKERNVIARAMASVYGFARGELLRAPQLDWKTFEQR